MILKNGGEIMPLSHEQIEKLQAELAWIEERKKKANASEKKVEKVDKKYPPGYSNKRKKKLDQLWNAARRNIDKNTYIESANKKNKVQKNDLRKGGNNNLGIHGIIGENYRKDVIKRSQQFVAYCHEKHNIKTLGDIRPKMVGDFLQESLDSGSIRASTLRTYITQLRKFAECNVNAGITSHENLINVHHENLKVKNPYSKQNRVRGKKANGGTMSLREARVIASHAGKLHGPLAQSMVNVLIEVCPRISELQQIKWEHFDFAEKELKMTGKNMNKNNRPRIVHEFSDKTIQQLKDIYDTGLFTNPSTRIWGSYFGSQGTMRGFIKECATSGKVAYLGLHAFRNASKEYHMTNLEKQEKRCKTKEQKEAFRKDIVRQFMRHVSADERLNPMVPRTKKVWVPVTDKQGNQLYRKDGKPKVEAKYIPHPDAQGNPVMVRKYQEEDLLTHRTDYLKNMLVSQILGHNRRDVVGEY